MILTSIGPGAPFHRASTPMTAFGNTEIWPASCHAQSPCWSLPASSPRRAVIPLQCKLPVKSTGRPSRRAYGTGRSRLERVPRVLQDSVASYFASPAATSQPRTATQIDVSEEVKRCLACHGSVEAGAAATVAPVLMGQHQPYLEKAITDYLHRRRSHDVMSPQVVSADGTPLLTEEAIARIAMWFSRQPGLFVR